MKTRNGFVSNSSSSSFVIALKKGEVCPTCHRCDSSFLDRFSRNADDYESSRIMAEEVEEVIDALKKNYAGDFEDVCGEEKLFRNILQAYVNTNYDVAYIRIAYQDEILQYEFDSLKEKKSLVVLKDMN